MITQAGRCIENQFVHVSIEQNGTLTLLDKTSGQEFEELLTFEDVGDIGNEYIFKQPENEKAILSKDQPTSTVEIIKDTSEIAQIKLTQTIDIPISADARLEKEQQMVREFRFRQAQRAKETKPLTITTLITLRAESKKIDFKTTIDNQMKDHRLRVLFPTKLHVEQHEADSIFEVVARPNQVSASWENPTNPQHQHAFVQLGDESQGITIGNFGLNEYEILDGKTIAVTLLRCVGEMGDWGYFPTPEAQCLGVHQFDYSLEVHSGKDKFDTYKHAYAAQIPFSTKQLSNQVGKLSPKKQYLSIEGETFAITALKRSKLNDKLVARGFNMSSHLESLHLMKNGKKGKRLNLLEEECQETIDEMLQPYEIRTVGFEEE